MQITQQVMANLIDTWGESFVREHALKLSEIFQEALIGCMLEEASKGCMYPAGKYHRHVAECACRAYLLAQPDCPKALPPKITFG